MQIENKEIFTAKEACAYLKISAVTLWRERKAGKIGFRRAASKILFTRQDLQDYLDRNKNEAFASVKEAHHV